MKGNKIVVKSPFGRDGEGLVSGTPKPGTLMQIKASVEPVGGKFTYEAYAPGVGDGAPRELIILTEDDYQGKTADDAYVSGTRCFLWFPLPGDELNVRKANISGTSSATEDLNIGERLLIVDGTGFVSPVAVGLANASAVYPFVALETLNDQAAEALVHCRVSMF